MASLDYWTCSEALARLDDYLDRELAPAELDGIREHLRVCAVCEREFRFEASVLRAVRAKLSRIAVPARLHAEVWRAVQRERATSAEDPGDVRAAREPSLRSVY